MEELTEQTMKEKFDYLLFSAGSAISKKYAPIAKMIKKILSKEVNISSLRVGNVSGDHKVVFGTIGETIELSHRALSRRTFADGVLMSALFLLQAKPKLYNFSEVMEEKI